ncbi:MAG: hypothetical protein HQM00_07790 [Magnetococcales bacterium]|nr:hypothetical protein [Magnetococcales bacterium]
MTPRVWLRGLVVLVGVVSGSGEVWADLFCVTDFAGRRCSYHDVDACRRAAGSQGGCDLNRAELVKPIGAAPVCLVEQGRIECVYMDRASCEKRAAITRTLCVEHTVLLDGSMVIPVGSGSDAEPPKGGYLPSPGYRPGVER